MGKVKTKVSIKTTLKVLFVSLNDIFILYYIYKPKNTIFVLKSGIYTSNLVYIFRKKTDNCHNALKKMSQWVLKML